MCVWAESHSSRYMLEEHMNEFWWSTGAGGGETSVGVKGQDRPWQLQGRRSSWAEHIYRATFLRIRIRLLSKRAPDAPRHPHPPVVWWSSPPLFTDYMFWTALLQAFQSKAKYLKKINSTTFQSEMLPFLFFYSTTGYHKWTSTQRNRSKQRLKIQKQKHRD